MTGRERAYRVEAVVLRHVDWGEADRLLTLYTREQGKLRVVAKGARKPRSRKAGHLEPFTRVNLLLARGRDLPVVTQAETIEPYTRLRDDLLLATCAAYVVELVDRFTYEEGENYDIYRLLSDSLDRISTNPNPEMVLRYFELRLLDLVGFRPLLFQCASCAKEILPEDQYFSAELGGVLCPRCGTGLTGVRPVSMTGLKYLRHFQRSAYTVAVQAPLSPAVSREMENLMQHYLTYLLERGLNTPAFLRRVRKNAQAPAELDGE